MMFTNGFVYFFSSLIISSVTASAEYYVEVMYDLIGNNEKSMMVTEFSCNKSDSFRLFKILAENMNPSRVLPVISENLEYPCPPNRQISILNLDCPNSTFLLEQANSKKWFASPLQWIFFSSTTTETSIEKYFSEIDILIDSDVILLRPEKNETLSVKTIYKRKRNQAVVIETVGSWSRTGGLVLYTNKNETVRKRNDMRKIKLDTCIVITHNDSLNHLTDKRDKHIDSIAKVNYVLVEHLADIVNVTLNYSIQPTWGYKDNKSEWSGMIGELTRNEADIGGTALFFTMDRVDIIDYIAMTTPTRSKFVFREPKLSYVTNVFTLPFDDYVWSSTISLVILIGIILFIILKWEGVKKRKLDGRVCTNIRESLE